jgi:3-hydroxyisobutyrate dehydrogenase-like beta-hydroxyacid dehydrogenase
MSIPALGFIGFGEAAFWIARGLRGAGVTRIVAYDLHTDTAGRGDLIRQRASEAGVRLLPCISAVPPECDIVISAVTATAARSVGLEAAAHLDARHLYADINSVSPAAKKAIGDAVASGGARFVEAAVMSTVPPLGHGVPMLLCGPGAADFSARMTPFGMKLEVLDGPPGSAASIKMFRSVIIKGLEALMLECVLAAEPYGGAKRVFDSVSASIPGLDWHKLANYMIGRSVLHAERRAQEMMEVAATLSDLGIDPIMATATARRIETCLPLDPKARFAGREPADYRDVVRAFREESQK